MKSRQAGMTLIELLVATALFLLLIGLTAQVFRGTRVAYEKNASVSNERQNLQSAIAQFRYEVSLAGYRGTDLGTFTGNSFTQEPFTVGNGAGPGNSDTITVEYYEDRYTSSTTFKKATFELSAGDLVRVDGGTKEKLIGGVQDLQLVYWFDNKVRLRALTDDPGANRPPPSDLSGVVIRLTMADGSKEDVPVSFKNCQAQTLSGCS